MTEPKLTGSKSGFLFGIRTEEKDKTYTLTVEALSTEEAINKFSLAITAIKNNELIVNHNYGIAGSDFTFCVQNTSDQHSADNRNGSIVEVRKKMVSQLVSIMSSEEQTWHLPGAVHAAIAALFVLYDQDLVAMELRKILSFNTGPSGK
ncbi:hypothetical protein J4S47_000366 [Salmonella enterica]|nr:hypothetical protein [Salmonella enterica]EHN6575487.1 hypothetical protein [Salmonella enterica subsp. enterica serovar Anecho]